MALASLLVRCVDELDTVLTNVGNLPTEKATKRDVFRKFSRYGRLAQISMKQAYGFVQFADSESCAQAKEVEQDSSIKGRQIRKCIT
jgi:RNA recognition motif-containing protein